jgi:transcriptional regulator with XRE-family HTH domain
MKTTFAEVLKKLMHERKISAKALSIATGIPQSSISEYSNGSRSPTLGEPVLALARFFDVTIEYLCTGINREEAIVRDLLSTDEPEFISIHKGVYRLNLEKYVPPTRRKPK